MPNSRDYPRHARVVSTMLIAMLLAGCVRPLAVQHEHFSPLSGSLAGISTRAQHAVSRHRALQAARHGCPAPVQDTPGPGDADLPEGPNLGTVAAREALADLCATPTRTPAAAYGATSNAYRRWVDDRVRELPEASETAAGAAGGS